jgi:hypothetical protein
MQKYKQRKKYKLREKSRQNIGNTNREIDKSKIDKTTNKEKEIQTEANCNKHGEKD